MTYRPALLYVALFVPYLSYAQGAPPPRLVLQALDLDGDGQLSAAEIGAASASLATLDRNRDGQITGDEYNPKLQDKTAGSDMVKRLMLLDTNGDGVLTAAEVPARMQAMFARGDTNHDGTLTVAEIQAMSAGQSDPQGRPLGHGNATGMLRLDPVMDALDADHDGVLSAAEIASAPGALKVLDTNADGMLDATELRMRQQTAAQRAEHLFDEWDTNKDGGLVKAELPDRMQPQFEAIDVNHDGRIDVQEATAYYAAMPQGNAARPAADRDPRQHTPNALPAAVAPQPALPQR